MPVRLRQAGRHAAGPTAGTDSSRHARPVSAGDHQHHQTTAARRSGRARRGHPRAAGPPPRLSDRHTHATGRVLPGVRRRRPRQRPRRRPATRGHRRPFHHQRLRATGVRHHPCPDHGHDRPRSLLRGTRRPFSATVARQRGGGPSLHRTHVNGCPAAVSWPGARVAWCDSGGRPSTRRAPPAPGRRTGCRR